VSTGLAISAAGADLKMEERVGDWRRRLTKLVESSGWLSR
jgi:hypothetical protein